MKEIRNNQDEGQKQSLEPLEKKTTKESQLRKVIGLLAISTSIYIGFSNNSVLWGVIAFVVINLIGAPILMFLERRKQKVQKLSSKMSKREATVYDDEFDDDDEIELPYSFHTPMASIINRKN